MKKVWFAVVFIALILSVNFIYAFRIQAFSDKITSITNQAISFIDTDYTACGKCIDTLLEEFDKSSLLLYCFSNRSKVNEVELASQTAAEYYKSGSTEALKHQLLMIQHRMDELKKSGEFSLENLLQTNKKAEQFAQLEF